MWGCLVPRLECQGLSEAKMTHPLSALAYGLPGTIKTACLEKSPHLL